MTIDSTNSALLIVAHGSTVHADFAVIGPGDIASLRRACREIPRAILRAFRESPAAGEVPRDTQKSSAVVCGYRFPRGNAAFQMPA